MVSGRSSNEDSNSISIEPIDAALLSFNVVSNGIDGNLSENWALVQASGLTSFEDEPSTESR
jgi:hypothetical protein